MPKRKTARSKGEKQGIWKWWDEEEDDGRERGVKWKTLEHNGPYLPPPYQRLPENVHFYYDGKPMKLCDGAEEAAVFYAKTRHKYKQEDIFKRNFFEDWKKVMIPEEREVITDFEKCDFKYIKTFYKQQNRNRLSIASKQARQTEKRKLKEKYGFCKVDGRKQIVGNFPIEPPGIFVGSGEHSKRGMLKKRVEAEDIVINIGEESQVPDPPPGYQWKEVRHDNSVSWLASWTDDLWGSTKYVQLSPSSDVKCSYSFFSVHCKEDMQKFEAARKLKDHIDRIRDDYAHDLESGNLLERQRAVAMYFIDKLSFGLGANNENDDGTPDTVDCCSLRVKHVNLHEEEFDQDCVVSFDFWGKDGIRYTDIVAVEKRVFENLKVFVRDRQPEDDLFDLFNSTFLSEYMGGFMEGLTVKVLRSYIASQAMQATLDRLTSAHASKEKKLLVYYQANREVALLCNHKLSISKGFSRRIRKLKVQIGKKEKLIEKQEKEVEIAESDLERVCQEKLPFEPQEQLKKLVMEEDEESELFEQGTSQRNYSNTDAAAALIEKEKQLADSQKQLETWRMQLEKLESLVVNVKMLNLTTSKLNYLDPRITVAWCKKFGISLKNVFSKKQRDRFRWAIDTAGPKFQF